MKLLLCVTAYETIVKSCMLANVKKNEISKLYIMI